VSSALGFILAALALMAGVVFVLARAWWQGARQAHDAQPPSAQEMAQANTQVYRDQLEELEREYLAGNLTQAELHATRDELAQRLLDDVATDAPALVTSAPSASDEVKAFRKPWRAVVALGVALPVLAVVMYGVLGQPMALDPSVLARGAGENEEVTPEKLATMATALIRRLQDEPNSMEGWVMLGRVQRARGRYEEAAEALAKALALSRDDNLLIERAEVLAQKNGGSFAGEPWSIIQRVLAADPHHLNALFLAGSASYAEMNFRSALRFWERAREVVAADSPDAPELDRAIAEARQQLGLPPIPARAATAKNNAPSGPANAAQQAVRISGRVSVAPELASKVAPSDTVFIYATPVSGSRMPVAIVKISASQLPYDFVLDDSTAMNPNVKLSGMEEVTVRARISKTGNAAAQPNDLGVSVTPVKPGSAGLNLMVREALR